MAMNTDEHPVELTPTEARSAGIGRHVLIILGVSTILAAIGLAAFFTGTAAMG